MKLALIDIHKDTIDISIYTCVQSSLLLLSNVENRKRIVKDTGDFITSIQTLFKDLSIDKVLVLSCDHSVDFEELRSLGYKLSSKNSIKIKAINLNLEFFRRKVDVTSSILVSSLLFP